MRRRGPGLLAAGLLSACTSGPPAVAESGPFDWTLGTWQGVRRDAASGREAPMTMVVEPILGGSGQIRHITIPTTKGCYRGFAVQVPAADDSGWVREYVNEGRGSFSTLAGELQADGSIWRSVTVGRSRESRLVSEQLSGGSWRRTMSVSEDGGSSWADLWVDELER